MITWPGGVVSVTKGAPSPRPPRRTRLIFSLCPEGYFSRGVLIMLSLSLPRLSGLAQLQWGLNGFMGYPVGRRIASRFPWQIIQ